MADQIIDQIDALMKYAIPTMCHLVQLWPEIPFWELCRQLAGAPYFGEGGVAGYEAESIYRIDPKRIPAFWAKEIILDCLATGNWGLRERPDAKCRAPVGNGSRRGLGLAMGVICENSGLKTIPEMLQGSRACEIMYRIFELREEFGCAELVRDINDVQWNFCEFRKVWVRHPRRLRKCYRNAPQPKAKPAAAPPVTVPKAQTPRPEMCFARYIARAIRATGMIAQIEKDA